MIELVYELNNENNNKSNKIRKVSLIIQYITKKLAQSQDIGRMLVYNTKNPLAIKGLSYDEKTINQPSLTEEKVKPYVFDVGFNPEIVLKNKNQVFINISRGRFVSNQNRLNIEFNIVVPEIFSKISNGYRHFEIAQSITDLLDEKFIDSNDIEDYYKSLGALKFELTDFSNGRLSKTENYVWLSMMFEVELLGGKYRVNLGNVY